MTTSTAFAIGQRCSQTGLPLNLSSNGRTQITSATRQPTSAPKKRERCAVIAAIIQSAHARALRESKVMQLGHYTCRHTWPTRAVEAGIDLATLAAMLGHSKIDMVLRYAQPTQEHQKNAMAMMFEIGQRSEVG